jgi:acetoin utilization deacetylase AcuC-like enzyme
MTLTAYYHPAMVVSLGDHIMPINKFTLVADGLRGAAGVRLEEPSPLEEADLLRVHTPEHIQAGADPLYIPAPER